MNRSLSLSHRRTPLAFRRALALSSRSSPPWSWSSSSPNMMSTSTSTSMAIKAATANGIAPDIGVVGQVGQVGHRWSTNNNGGFHYDFYSNSNSSWNSANVGAPGAASYQDPIRLHFGMGGRHASDDQNQDQEVQIYQEKRLNQRQRQRHQIAISRRQKRPSAATPLTTRASATALIHSSHFDPILTPAAQIQNKAWMHSSHSPERAAAIMLTLASISAGAFAASSAIKSYNEWKTTQPSPEEQTDADADTDANSRQNSQNQDASASTSTNTNTNTQQNKGKGNKQESERSDKNVFKEWFGVGVGAKYYEGGFEETMTRREAALILGVRESSPPDRIKTAHRKLLVLNHPDTGGSTYMAGKINEAKELLLKGRTSI